MKVEDHPLSDQERAKLLDRLDILLGVLGAPGDWGYNTELGQTTLQLIDLRHRLAGAKG